MISSRKIATACLLISLSLMSICSWSSASNSESNHDLEIYLGLKYLHGAPPDVEKDIEKARQFFYPAALSGDPIAQFFLSRTYSPDCFGTGSRCEHEKWLEKAAGNGDSTAELLFGLRLFGLGQTHHLGAIQWVRKSAIQGNQSAKVELGRLMLKAIDATEPGEDLSRACEAFKQNKHIIGDNVFTDFLSANCNFISYDEFIDAAFLKSESGSVAATLLIGGVFEEALELSRALRYYRLGIEQLKVSQPLTFLDSQIATGVINPREDVARIETRIENAQKATRESRLARLLDKQAKIDADYQSSTPIYEEPAPEKPFVKFLKRAAHITLYAIATGLASAAEEYANQSFEPDYNGYRTSSKPTYTDFAKPINNYSSSNNFKGSYTPQPSRSFASSCRCACVDGQQVSLCTSAVAVPAICTGVCPINPPTYQPPSVRPPPPGTTKCYNRNVYNRALGRYETKSVCE